MALLLKGEKKKKKTGLGKWRVLLQGATWPWTFTSGQGLLWHSPSPARGQRHLQPGPGTLEKPWKRPGHSQLEPGKHSVGLPGARWCWQSKRGSSILNMLFSKQLLHAKQREDWTSEELCPGNLQEDNVISQSSTILPPSWGQTHPLHPVGMPTFFLRGKHGRTDHHRLNTTPRLRHQYPSYISFTLCAFENHHPSFQIPKLNLV